MVEPEKPFACSMPDCGMTFTNEDHLHVHTKKHDMVLQFGLEQKAAFVADQTPTPTRFIRNCEEVGLFLDLQNDNPFEEGFKRAMETAKHGLPLPPLEHPPSTEDLHTPQMFPLIDQTDSALFTTNNQRNITISRSSSDESGAIKEYETTTISKLTNEVTTISRRVEKHDIEKLSDDTAKHTDRQKDISETSVSYTNNVIKIRKDNLVNVECSKNGQNNLISYTDSVIKDVNIAKDLLEVEKLQVPPIMSQKSIDFVVDTLTSEICRHPSADELKRSLNSEICRHPNADDLKRSLNSDICKHRNADNVERNINLDISKHPNIDDLKKEKEINKNDKTSDIDEYTVTITLPGGKKIKMKPVDNVETPKTVNNNTREKLKNAIANKVVQTIPIIQNIPVGTLIPVTLIPQIVNKVPIAPLAADKDRFIKKPVKRRRKSKNDVAGRREEKRDDDCILIEPPEKKKLTREDLNCRVAASRRYRVRLRETMNHQVSEISRLKESNQKLAAELAALKAMVIGHLRNCPNAADLRMPPQKLHVPENT